MQSITAGICKRYDSRVIADLIELCVVRNVESFAPGDYSPPRGADNHIGGGSLV